jgi:hypothetical protein
VIDADAPHPIIQEHLGLVPGRHEDIALEISGDPDTVVVSNQCQLIPFEQSILGYQDRIVCISELIQRLGRIKILVNSHVESPKSVPASRCALRCT